MVEHVALPPRAVPRHHYTPVATAQTKHLVRGESAGFGDHHKKLLSNQDFRD